MSENKLKRNGRPNKSIVWPDGKFTVKDLLGNGLSAVSVQIKINKAKIAGQVVEVEKVKTSGRPKSVYQKVLQTV